MKFKRREWISYKFGKALYNTIKDEYSDLKFDVITYVPMSPLREFSRGFNRSQEFADIISKETKVPVKKILHKKPGVKTQSGLNRKERIENVRNAFFVRHSELLTDKVVLLIDDVFTTGSTVNECARILKRNGALAVYVATLATTVYDE